MFDFDYETFIQSYLETAAWAACLTDAEGNEINGEDYEFSPEAILYLTRQALAFLSTPGVLEALAGREDQGGHDFWLTSNHHGAGFWDGDWEEEAGEFLTKASRPYATDLYCGDDDLIHID